MVFTDKNNKKTERVINFSYMVSGEEFREENFLALFNPKKLYPTRQSEFRDLCLLILSVDKVEFEVIEGPDETLDLARKRRTS